MTEGLAGLTSQYDLWWLAHNLSWVNRAAMNPYQFTLGVGINKQTMQSQNHADGGLDVLKSEKYHNYTDLKGWGTCVIGSCVLYGVLTQDNLLYSKTRSVEYWLHRFMKNCSEGKKLILFLSRVICYANSFSVEFRDYFLHNWKKIFSVKKYYKTAFNKFPCNTVRRSQVWTSITWKHPISECLLI